MTRFSPEQKKRSAINLVQYLLAIRDESIVPAHMRELLSTLIWKITEASGKYTPEFVSLAASEATDQKMLIHEHVIERAKLIDRLLAGENPATVLNEAVACLVTIDEHARLTAVSKSDPSLNGWERYVAAKIEFRKRT
jgi:hypothetical protein